MLVFGIIGLPIPDEVMMTIVGYFTNIHVLNYELAILVSFAGALSGMLISYIIGRKAGRPVIEKYGKWIGLKEKRIIKFENLYVVRCYRRIFMVFHVYYNRQRYRNYS